ncbi:hypothetical protein [Streptomyces sp. NPDC058434]|uniref:SGM_3592 family protein n=1 Tax=Streptomyces sp. NPDC058434 TaxID=3346498 RepID=UPI003653F2E9
MPEEPNLPSGADAGPDRDERGPGPDPASGAPGPDRAGHGDGPPRGDAARRGTGGRPGGDAHAAGSASASASGEGGHEGAWDEAVLDEDFVRAAETAEPSARARMLAARWRGSAPQPQPWRSDEPPAGWFWSRARARRRRRRWWRRS